MQPRLQVQHITKRYGDLLANDGVSLCVAAGEIHAVLGENGAGKSTLMKVIYGVVAPDAGEISIDGQTVQITNPQAARALGLAMVFQHFSLFDTLSVAQNVWLGLDKSWQLSDVSTQIKATSAAYGLEVDPARAVHTLSVGERQRVEIIRALLTKPKILILDEPTSVLTPQAVEKLFGVLRQLAAEGCSIIYISHKLHEIRALAHHCTVMRGGRVVATCVPKNETNESLAGMMMGASSTLSPTPSPVNGGGEKTESPSPASGRGEKTELHSSSKGQVTGNRKPHARVRERGWGEGLEVFSGEIIGIAGVSGNGQQALFSTLLQAAQHKVSGKGSDDIHISGRAHFVPEERLGTGAVPSLSLAQNLLLTRTETVTRKWGIDWLKPAALKDLAQNIISRFGVKTAGTQAPAASLSGGNLQKFIVGREIDAKPDLLVIAQPTWGVDVGAAALIHQEIRQLAGNGAGVLLISDELEELFLLCNRLYVMSGGLLSPSLDIKDATPSLVGEWMSGGWQQ